MRARCVPHVRTRSLECTVVELQNAFHNPICDYGLLRYLPNRRVISTHTDPVTACRAERRRSQTRGIGMPRSERPTLLSCRCIWAASRWLCLQSARRALQVLPRSAAQVAARGRHHRTTATAGGGERRRHRLQGCRARRAGVPTAAARAVSGPRALNSSSGGRGSGGRDGGGKGGGGGLGGGGRR